MMDPLPRYIGVVLYGFAQEFEWALVLRNQRAEEGRRVFQRVLILFVFGSEWISRFLRGLVRSGDKMVYNMYN